MSFAKYLEITSTGDINDRSDVSLLLVVLASLFGYQRPQVVEIQRRAVVTLLCQVIVTHTNLSEVTWMVLVPIDSVVMLASGITTTSWMFPVFTNTSMTMTNMSTRLPGLLILGRHLGL